MIMMTRIFCVAGMLAAISQSGAAESWWRVFGTIGEGAYVGGGHDDEDGKPDPALIEFLATEKFDEWETFEDEAVKLVYPKHPLLKLEVKGGKEGIQVEGGVCTTVDNSFQRAYVLKAGEATYGVFLLTKASWLDDGICFCGPMVHHVYRVEDGCLARFSLLPGGAVKKAQLLGDKVRLMSFEWTHLACKRPIYEEMVERMTLKIPSLWSGERLRDEVIRRYGMEGRAGWLSPGIGLAKADEIMASSSAETGGIRRWLDVQENYPTKLEAAFDNGTLVKLTTEGVQRTGDEAVKGTLDWAEDRFELLTRGPRHPDPFQEAASPPKPTPEQLAEVVEAVVSLSAKIPESDWWRCVSLMAELSKDHGIRDGRFTTAIVTRGKGSGNELETLKNLGYAKLDEWVVACLQAMQLEAPSKSDTASTFDDPVGDRAGAAAELIGFLAEKNHPQVASLAQSLFRTGEPAWVMAAIECADHVEPEFAQEIIRESMKQAIAQQSGQLLEKIFDRLPSLKLKNPAEIVALIDQLPKGEADGDWEKSKSTAREALGKMTAEPTP
jgi:hypothetical protein